MEYDLGDICNRCGIRFGLHSKFHHKCPVLKTMLVNGDPITWSETQSFKPIPSPTLKPDPVNHPSHYNDVVPGIECIQVTRHFNFNRGNAIKYLWRAGNKDKAKEIEDLEKAIFYLRDEIERLKTGAISDEAKE